MQVVMSAIKLAQQRLLGSPLKFTYTLTSLRRSVYGSVRLLRVDVACSLPLVQGRSIKYAPITDGYAANAKVVNQKTACACTSDGRSGSARLPNNLSGCRQHSLNMGDTEYYCYTNGGTDCAAATPSNTYAGKT